MIACQEKVHRARAVEVPAVSIRMRGKETAGDAQLVEAHIDLDDRLELEGKDKGQAALLMVWLTKRTAMPVCSW